MKYAVIAAALLSFSTSAQASGDHAGGHNESGNIGEAGTKNKVTQTIMVTMKEMDDGKMVFMPANIQVKEGQTVSFQIRNSGQSDHEFVFNTENEILEHKKVMEKFPEMEHDDPNAIRLKSGQTGTIIWRFSKAGVFTFACLIPGHYDAGMHGQISVNQK